MTHLNQDQISAILIGDAAPSDIRHAQECRECAAEVAHIESALGLFRSAVDQAALHVPEHLFAPLTYGSYRPRETAAAIYSMLFHSAALASILAIGMVHPMVTKSRPTFVSLVAPVLKPYVAEHKPAQGGGGGGTRSPLPQSEGQLPKSMHRPFVPPRVDPPAEAKLVLPASILADAPDFSVSNIGDPLSHIGVPSNGQGCCAGLGGGDGQGVGVGHGPGAGQGLDGGFGRGAFQIGGGVSSPVALVKVEPEYSEDARKARFQGTVRLEIVVDEHGIPRQMRVLRSLGMGLDEKAMEAVAKWRFKPGTKAGKPVPVVAVIDVSFHLL
jgi:TonB family protein